MLPLCCRLTIHTFLLTTPVHCLRTATTLLHCLHHTHCTFLHALHLPSVGCLPIPPHGPPPPHTCHPLPILLPPPHFLTPPYLYSQPPLYLPCELLLGLPGTRRQVGSLSHTYCAAYLSDALQFNARSRRYYDENVHDRGALLINTCRIPHRRLTHILSSIDIAHVKRRRLVGRNGRTLKETGGVPKKEDNNAPSSATAPGHGVYSGSSIAQHKRTVKRGALHFTLLRIGAGE